MQSIKTNPNYRQQDQGRIIIDNIHFDFGAPLSTSDLSNKREITKEKMVSVAQPISLSHLSSTLSKELSPLSSVSNRVSENAEPCIENTSSRVSNRVSSRVSKSYELKPEERLIPTPPAIEKMKDKAVLRYAFVEDPAQTIYNLSRILPTICGRDAKKLTNTVKAIMKAVEFDSLYGVGQWDRMAERQCKQALKETSADNSGLLLSVFRGVVVDHIPVENMVVPNRSRLTPIELAHVAKTITNRIIKDYDETGRSYALINNNYFMQKGNPKEYQKVTGRSIGKTRNKIATITTLLNEAGIITKQHRLNDAHRQDRNLYAMGANNPYIDRLSE